MAVDCFFIKQQLKEEDFITGSRTMIEFLLGIDLDMLEEYLLVIQNSRIYFITPGTEEIEGVTCIPYTGYSNVEYQDKRQNILSCLSQISFHPVLFMYLEEEGAFYYRYFLKKGHEIKDFTFNLREQIQTKTALQLRRIEDCVILNQNAYRRVKEQFRMGMSELDVLSLIQKSYFTDTGEKIMFVGDIAAGLRTCDVSAQPTDYILKSGDPLILDLLPRRKGVYSDTTRTFFVGKPTAGQRKVYQILLEAMEAAETYLVPGASGMEVYRAMAKVFESHNLINNFPHHAGHSFGFSIYEAPYFIQNDRNILKKDMTVTLEPGLYLEEEFGIRIENNYRITDNGCRKLGNIPLAIEYYILD